MNTFVFEKSREPQPGLGRVHIPDPKDELWTPENARARGILPVSAFSGVDYMYWGMPDIENQGQTSYCVAYSTVTSLAFYVNPWPRTKLPQFSTVYVWAQNNDEWPGAEPTYYGTSVRAGLEYLRTFGFIQSYHRLTTIQEVVEWVIDQGPVCVGTNWYQYQYDADRVTGRVTPVANSKLWGGHAYVIYGCNRKRGTFSFQNSHGVSYGRLGRAIIDVEAMEKLIFDEYGDSYGFVKNLPPV